MLHLMTCELEVNQFYFQVKWSHSANC